MTKYTFILLFLLSIVSTISKADHIMGNEMSYRCLSGNNYEIDLKIYRNCISTNNNIDNDVVITIFNKANNSFIRTITLPIVSNVEIPNPPSTPCFDAPTRNEVCVQTLGYSGVINLASSTTGYLLVFQRCCRNPSISNIRNVGSIGSTLQLEIPPSTVATCNSTPKFDENAPNFVCINKRELMDFSATDPDGDRLVYSLVAPKQGLDNNCPVINNNNPCNLTRAEQPPYADVIYNNGFTYLNPFGPNSIISIDSLTGIVSVVGGSVGKFTIAVSVKEYRNGVLLGQVVRDYQVNVIDCNLVSSIPIVVTDNSTSSAIRINDTTFSNCQGAVVRFDNEINQSGITYFWDFGVPGITNDTAIIKNPTYTYSDTGVYYVTLIINKGKPCSDTSRIKVIYYPGLTANFTTGIINCQNELIQLRDSSVSAYNDITNWQWILSAGDTSYIKNPVKLYPNSGTYNVTLTTTTSKGCVAKVTKPIVVNPKPKANFTANYLCYKNSTAFTDASTISVGSITKYLWAFGDGSSDTLKNTAHIYNTFADSFSVKHVVTSAAGCKDSIIKKIKMDDTVKISYTTSPSALCEKLPVTFTNTSTGGNPTGFQWIINNGTPINGNSASYTFPNGGTFPVKLIATTRCGKDTLHSTITINSNPIINLGNDITVCNKGTKTITAIGSFDSIRWNTGQNSSTITLDGNRTPINIAVYKNGCVGRDTVLVKKQIITPNFSNTYLCLNKPITFNNTSTVNSGTLTQFDWKYGDGGFDNTIQHPTHTFTSFGNYNVQLIATSDIGCKDTFVKNIAMDTVLNVDFKTAEVVSCQRKAVDFINLTTGGINNQNIWRIENNNFTTKDKSYTFLGTGNFPVKLVVSNRCYADSISKNIQILPRPNVYLGRDTVLCKNQTVSFTVNPSSYDSIRWVNGSTAATQIVDGSINPFKIKVYISGCVAEDTVVVRAPKLNLNFTNDFLCFNKPITFNNTSTITIGSIANYNWNFGDGQTINGVKNPSHTYNIFGPKTIQLIATGNLGACADTLRKTIAMDDSISFAVNPIPSEICYGASKQYQNLSTGGVNTLYSWTLNNNNLQTGNTANYTHTAVGNNSIKLVAAHRCGEDSIRYYFNVLPLPKLNLGNDSIIMCPGEIKMIGITAVSDSIFWSTGERDMDSISINGLVSPIKVDVYNKGCLSKDSIFVSTNCDVFIPTAFSPNNDGVNDEFNMMNKSIKSYTLKIYNRWGELVFETNNLNNSWNGTYKGEPCQVDNYIYVVSGIRSNNESFYLKGILSLFR